MTESLRSIIKAALKDHTGEYSATRIFESLCYLTATFIVVWLCVVGAFNENYFLIYLGALSTRGAVNKALEERYKSKEPT